MCQLSEITRGTLLKCEVESKYLSKGTTVKVVSVYNKLPTFTVEVGSCQFLLVSKADCEHFSLVE
jgi:hypothetical protein